MQYLGGRTDPAHVADSSGNGLDGTILTGAGGTVTSVAEPDGNRFLHFPGGTCLTAPCPQGIVHPASPGPSCRWSDGTNLPSDG